MARGGDAHRLIRWLWRSRRPDAKLARLGLLPLAAIWRAGMAAREAAYRQEWLTVHTLPLPSIAVGNLTVGGTGKTPIAIWIAQYYAGLGLIPGILLRGYGRDETLVHRRAVPLRPRAHRPPTELAVLRFRMPDRPAEHAPRWQRE